MLKKLRKEIRSLANPEKAKILAGFFKTGKGQYGEGNVVRVVQGVDGWRPRDYLRFLLQSRRAKVLALRQKDYCLVIPGSLRSAGVSP